jgi:uncharacterized protein YecT (DUF1311 family)
MGASAALACVIAVASPGANAATGPSARLKPPVIKESFTPLPCTGAPGSRTTVQMEGCAEQQILRGDTTINALSAQVFARLADRPARRRFIADHRAWVAYRRADCLSRSDTFEGGSGAPVVFARCVVSLNGQRITDLRTFLAELARR